MGSFLTVLNKDGNSFLRSDQNGPDQILETKDYATSERTQPVKLRQEECGLGSEIPLSVPSLLEVCQKYIVYYMVTELNAMK